MTARIDGVVVAAGTDGRAPLVGPFHLAIEPGESVAIVGESGSGKSLLCRALAGVLPSNLTFHGTRVGPQTAIIPQDPAQILHPQRRVGTSIAHLIRHARRGRPVADGVHITVARLLAEADLDPSVARKYPHELSGGMRQRAALALVRASGAPLVIADESTSALDVETRNVVLDLLARRVAEDDHALVVVSHDHEAVARICRRVLVMHAGLVVEEGPADRLFARPWHPFTRAMVEARPRRGDARERLPTIPADDAADREAQGCRFARRCPIAFERCRREEPLLAAPAGRGGRRVACHAPLREAGDEG